MGYHSRSSSQSTTQRSGYDLWDVHNLKLKMVPGSESDEELEPEDRHYWKSRLSGKQDRTTSNTAPNHNRSPSRTETGPLVPTTASTPSNLVPPSLANPAAVTHVDLLVDSLIAYDGPPPSIPATSKTNHAISPPPPSASASDTPTLLVESHRRIAPLPKRAKHDVQNEVHSPELDISDFLVSATACSRCRGVTDEQLHRNFFHNDFLKSSQPHLVFLTPGLTMDDLKMALLKLEKERNAHMFHRTRVERELKAKIKVIEGLERKITRFTDTWKELGLRLKDDVE
ncbi:hypothetical protein CVT24_001863 [Panaeolus cyanescens]|uniref:Uncharacterized protein n=1 Tax=Panaeolus cyanescens TaxID=181874 RepID=A0A409X084_9AGAR|nr:hypothetical protein CVT24_001863 [Panaeolus cyanescens]